MRVPNGVDLVLDVGANTGQFAQRIMARGYRKEIVSFEPLEAEHRELCRKSARIRWWNVHPRCALGDRDGEIMVNVSRNSYSSSVLPATPLLLSLHPETEYVSSQTVPVHKLDTVVGAYFAGHNRILLKMDVQGYEWQVLDGAEQILPYVYAVYTELSYEELYVGQKLGTDVLCRLEKAGFTLVSNTPGTAHQTDALLVRKA